MDKAKAAVSDFISKSGQHDTEVHESVDPAVQRETVKPHQREERQIATDREVHQDHYHTTVQPVHDREVLPEQHHHNIVPVEHRTHDKRDDQATAARLQATKAQFKDESVRTEMAHTSQAMPSVAGEHVHHHIHETIQPVVHKETVEPHVMHTTVPIHEVHHNQAQHHAATALPAMTMDDFKKSGGSLTGREERVDHFKGEPKNIERSLAGGSSGLRDSGFSSAGVATGALAAESGTAATHHGHHGHHGHQGQTTASIGQTTSASGVSPTTSSTLGAGAGAGSASQGVTADSFIKNRGANTNVGDTGSRSAVSGMTGNPDERVSTGSSTGRVSGDQGYGEFGHRHDGQHPQAVEQHLPGQDTTTGPSTTGSSGGAAGTNRKPSLMDRLNPKKDADGDGKAGFLS